MFSCDIFLMSLFPQDLPPVPLYESVWRVLVRKEVLIFSWLLVGLLVVYLQRHFICLSIPIWCLVQVHSEYLGHIFFHCSILILRLRVLRVVGLQWVIPCSVTELLSYNLGCFISKDGQLLWGSYDFSFILVTLTREE